MKIAIDVDGVLADFVTPFAALLEAQTGKIIPLPPTTWDFHYAAGITKAESRRAWEHITSTSFFFGLEEEPFAAETLHLLDNLNENGHQVYFITTRPGSQAKLWTEEWLNSRGVFVPTVLIAKDEPAKGLLAKGLALDVFIDDKPENCAEVVKATRQQIIYKGIETNTFVYPCIYLVNRPYNQDNNISNEVRPFMDGIVRIDSALQALERFMESTNADRHAA